MIWQWPRSLNKADIEANTRAPMFLVFIIQIISTTVSLFINGIDTQG